MLSRNQLRVRAGCANFAGCAAMLHLAVNVAVICHVCRQKCFVNVDSSTEWDRVCQVAQGSAGDQEKRVKIR